MRESTCSCAQRFVAVAVKAADYRRVKAILDEGKHPTFIGRDLVTTSARNGGVTIYLLDGRETAVTVVNPKLNSLLVLNVLPAHRSHGLGRAIVAYLQCNFARVIASAVPFFERCGYQCVDSAHQGRRFVTHVMVKSTLIPLAGRIARIYGPTRVSTD